MAQIIHLRFPADREPDTWARQPEPEPTETEWYADRVLIALGILGTGVWVLSIIEIARALL